MADTTPYPLPAGSQLLQDLGFQAFTLAGVDILQPTNKPRGRELTWAQKRRNQKISRRRGRIEHVNSSVKRCRMLKEVSVAWSSRVASRLRQPCLPANLPSWLLP
jgi:hypothetical protein